MFLGSFFLRFQANANGTVLQSEIVGSVKMRVYLTGMPELRLGLNDKVLFESSGSQCVCCFVKDILRDYDLCKICQ